MSLISINNITAAYGTHIALENVSMVVNEGDFIGIIGQNGGGKTTLLKVILGLKEVSAGNISYAENLNIGYLPQQSNIDKMFPITVKDVIHSGLMNCKGSFKQLKKDYKERFDSLTSKMNINIILNKVIGEISGGQLQKTLLCRSLLSKPDILLLDEPNTYIDKESEFELFEFIRNDNYVRAILLVSHDVGTISKYVKSYACVNNKLHYHNSNIIDDQLLNTYGCPIQLVAHGDIPHTVLKHHD